MLDLLICARAEECGQEMVPSELQSKLLKGDYMGDYIGDYYRGY